MSIIEKYDDKIKGRLSTFDRIIFKGHIRQLFGQSGKNYFLSQENVLLKNFAEYSEKITESICKNAEKLAKEVGQSVIYLYSPSISKEKTALEIIEKEKLTSGLICVLSTLELCTSFDIRKNVQTGKLELINRDRK